MRIVLLLAVCLHVLSGAGYARAFDTEQLLRAYERTVYLPAHKRAQCVRVLRNALAVYPWAFFDWMKEVDSRMREMGCLDAASTLHVRPKRAKPEGDPHVESVGDFLYIRIPHFYGNVHQSLRLQYHTESVLAKNRPSVVVVDVRDNPGGVKGLLAAIVEDFFVPAVGITYMQASGADDATRKGYTSKRVGVLAGLTYVLVADEKSASAAEWLVALIRFDFYPKQSAILGRQTYGKGIIQCALPHASSAHGGFYTVITCGEWTAGGEKVQGSGLTPDRSFKSDCKPGHAVCMVNEVRRLAGW